MGVMVMAVDTIYDIGCALLASCTGSALSKALHARKLLDFKSAMVSGSHPLDRMLPMAQDARCSVQEAFNLADAVIVSAKIV